MKHEITAPVTSSAMLSSGSDGLKPLSQRQQEGGAADGLLQT